MTSPVDPVTPGDNRFYQDAGGSWFMYAVDVERKVAEAVAAERAKTAHGIAAGIEAVRPHIPVSTHPKRRESIIIRSTLNRAARLARSFAAGSETTEEDEE